MHSEWVKLMPEGHMPLSNVLFAPLKIEGNVVGVLGISQKDGDFTEHDARLATAFGEYAAIALHNSRIFEMLHKQNRQLQELNATKDTFFSIIAHDLRNPFSGLMAGTGILGGYLQESNDKKLLDLAHELHNSAQRVYKLLENLLSWAQVQQGSIPYVPKTIDLTILAGYSMSLLREIAVHKQISLTNMIKKDLVVCADYDMLEAIFRNLISNAIKFTPKGGEVKISAQKGDGMIEIAVTDTGVGMSAAKTQKLFTIGERHISSQGTDGERGTGLGLILCKEFVELHGGTIWVESEQGNGSTFKFTLPKGGNE
jgi:signal transduction histidine kinase